MIDGWIINRKNVRHEVTRATVKVNVIKDSGSA